jgi:hypothetical protein
MNVKTVSCSKVKLSLFKDRVLRGTFGAEREEVLGRWKKLHNKGLQMKENQMGGTRSTEGEMINARRRPERAMTSGRPELR